VGLENLRRTLHDLRKALGAAASIVEATSRSVLALRLEGAEIDVVEFDRAVAAGTPAEWARAAGLFVGPLLDGQRDEWAAQERVRRDEAYLLVSEQLAQEARDRGAPEEAAGYLRKRARLDPYCERTHVALLEALDEAGRYTDGIALHQQFRRRLDEDLKVEPGPEVKEAYARLRRHARARLRGPRPAEERAKKKVPRPRKRPGHQ
jgi:DNA-binding SARP family transcriptional activator